MLVIRGEEDYRIEYFMTQVQMLIKQTFATAGFEPGLCSPERKTLHQIVVYEWKLLV